MSSEGESTLDCRTVQFLLVDGRKIQKVKKSFLAVSHVRLSEVTQSGGGDLIDFAKD